MQIPFEQEIEDSAQFTFNPDMVPQNIVPFQQEEPLSNTCITEGDYISQLTSLKDEMTTRNLKKFIFSRVQKVPIPESFEWMEYLEKLKKAYPSTFIYYLKHHDAGIWMGATPETLGQWHGSKFQTMSLAGTTPVSNSISWGAKEIQEQQYVTDYITSIFQKNHIRVNCSATHTVFAGPVAHLQTQISSAEGLNYPTALHLIQELHPTPAICGIPMQEAKNFITQNEKHERNYYTGYVGITKKNVSIELFVNLRCLQITQSHLLLYLGGGITHESNPELEWKETQEKAKTLLNLLPYKK